MAAYDPPVWDIDTEEGKVERTAEIVNDDHVKNPKTGSPGLRLDLSMLPLPSDSDLFSTILSDKLTFSTVTVLNLNDCGLNTLPRAISNMSNLIRLRLHSNNLKTLPEAIGDLRYLERLSLYGNSLESLPKTFYRLVRVRILRLGGNNLEGEDLDDIKKMSGLQQLYLRQNDKLKAIPRGVCESLTVLNADACHDLKDPPPDVIKEGLKEVRSYAKSNVW